MTQFEPIASGNASPIPSTKVLDTLIIGTGISGIGTAIKLLEMEINDFVLLEKHKDLGGTWRDNTYPGCECDVPSALYSYSFAQKNDWSKTFANQAEILEYVRKTAEDHGVIPYIRYGVTVLKAKWIPEYNIWQVETNQGSYFSQKLISCAGYLHEPIIPNLPGLSEFTGPVFHSSQWDHDLDLKDKEVAVIGTGASAIQFIPQIQPVVKKLTIFQRTPQWILPKQDHAHSKLEKDIFKLPLAMRGWRYLLYSALELFGKSFHHPKALSKIQQGATRHMRKIVKDSALRKKLTPDYTLGCKRVLLSNNYYPAIIQSNVELLASGVKAIKGNYVIVQDGEKRKADVIILGTGFKVSDMPIANVIHGEDGKTLADIWKGSPSAYRGTTIAGFPNFFLVLGPNLGIGHNSAYIVIESQLDYITGAYRAMKKHKIEKLQVNPEVQTQYNEKIQTALQTTVWNTGGCQSYYIDKNGRNSIGFPWSTYKMRKLLKTFDLESYK